MCKAHGWPTDTAKYRYFVGNGIPKLVERFSPEDRRDPETLAATLKEFDAEYGAHMFDKTAPIRACRSCWPVCTAMGVGWRCTPIKLTNLPGTW